MSSVEKRWNKLAWLPWDIADKAKMILVGVIPKALHACENLQLGGNHFAILRTAIAESIQSARGRPDPHLTCAIAGGPCLLYFAAVCHTPIL